MLQTSASRRPSRWRAIRYLLLCFGGLSAVDACTGDDPVLTAGNTDAEAPRDGAPSSPDGSTGDADPSSDEGQPKTFCQSQLDASFCDDFDTLSIPDRWRDTTSTDGGRVDLIADAGLSVPAAIQAMIPTDTSVGGAALTTDVKITQRVRVRGDFRVPAYGGASSDYVMLLAIVLSIQPMLGVRVIAYPKTGTVYLSVVHQGTGVEVASKSVTGTFLNVWTSIDLEVRIRPTVAANLRIGSASSEISTDSVDASAEAASVNSALVAGIPLTSSVGGETRVLIDNITAWAE